MREPTKESAIQQRACMKTTIDSTVTPVFFIFYIHFKICPLCLGKEKAERQHQSVWYREG